MKSRKQPPPVDFGANAGAEVAPANAPEPPQLTVVEGEISPAVAAPAPTWIATPSAPANPGRGWPVYLIAFVASALWALAPLAYAVGYRRGVAPLQDDIFGMTVFALLVIGPIALVWIAAVLVRQGQALSAEVRRMRGLAERMLEPAAAAAVDAGSVIEQVRDQIAEAARVAEMAQGRLQQLRAALAEETQALLSSAETSGRQASELTRTFGREREEMVALAGVLDARATAVGEAIAQQSRMVTDVSDLAEAQLREAQALLTARAADLTAAAGEASDAARVASDDLARQAARLETAGATVADQISSVEMSLTEQRAALITTAQAFRSDHEALAALTETQTAQLAEFVIEARHGAEEMSQTAGRGADALRRLVVEAADQFRDLSLAAKDEREAFGQAIGQSLDAVAEIASAERRRLEEQTKAAIEALARAGEDSRAAADAHAQAARAQVDELSQATLAASEAANHAFETQLAHAKSQIEQLGEATRGSAEAANQAFEQQLAQARDQIDQLSEATFAAGQNANKSFEARLGEARDLIERSAQMVEQAGARTAEKLDSGTAAARETLGELERLASEIAERSEQLPAQAKEQVASVRAAVADSMNDLLRAARRTAEETQAIDAAFQDRVRRNYEMLSEAVRMMGVVAGATASGLGQSSEAPIRSRRPAPVRDQPAAPLEATAAEVAAPTGLRPRLKLTPTATDEEFSTVFESAGGRVANDKESGDDGWTWGDLLSSMDGEDEDQRLQRRLTEELETLGVDAQALLPQGRIDELAVVVQAAQTEGAREVVRRLAPAAVRRLSRRLTTEPELKLVAARFLQMFGGVLDAAADRDPGGIEVAKLLSGETGRLYLFYDTAIGEPG